MAPEPSPALVDPLEWGVLVVFEGSMAEIDEVRKDVLLRLVWYGPKGAGRGRNIRELHDSFPAEQRSRLKAVDIRGDRTLSFELTLPVSDTWKLRLKLTALTGNVRSTDMKRKALTEADGVVFVARAARSRQLENRESFRELQSLIRDIHGEDATPPVGVIQFNHTDAPDAIDADHLASDWGRGGWPLFTAQAREGVGVRETLSSLVRLSWERLVAMHPRLEKEGLYLEPVTESLIAGMRGS